MKINRGIVAALSAAVLFGLSTPIAKILIGGMSPLLLYCLQVTDSAPASLILNLEGVFTALLAWFAFKETVDRRIALGMACIIAGGVLLSLGPRYRGGNLLGPWQLVLPVWRGGSITISRARCPFTIPC